MCKDKQIKIKRVLARVQLLKKEEEEKKKNKVKGVEKLQIYEKSKVIKKVKNVVEDLHWDEKAAREYLWKNNGKLPPLVPGEEKSEVIKNKKWKLLEEYAAARRLREKAEGVGVRKYSRNPHTHNPYDGRKGTKYYSNPKNITNNKEKYKKNFLHKYRKKILEEKRKKYKQIQKYKKKWKETRKKKKAWKNTKVRGKKGIWGLKESFIKKKYIYKLIKMLISISLLNENNIFIHINRMYSKIHNNLYFTKFIKYSKILSYILKYYIKVKQNIRYIFYKISGNYLTANIILNYIIIQLKKRFNLFEVINPLILTLVRYNKNLIGFKLMCCGRFSRKQIATFYWSLKGKISLSTTTSLIDYAQGTVILKNSLCGIKIWLSHAFPFLGNMRNKKFLHYYE